MPDLHFVACEERDELNYRMVCVCGEFMWGRMITGPVQAMRSHIEDVSIPRERPFASSGAKF